MPKVTTETWHDKGRNRNVPVKIYWPAATNPPLVIFSHGLGGSAESYKYIGEFLAANGIASLHPTHLGIDDSLLKGERPFQRLKEAADDKENLQNPPEDIQFILDYIEFKAMPFNQNKIALAGHSFGSYVALALAGQSVSRDGHEMDFMDERVKCAIAISPLASRKNPKASYEFIEIPVLHITGKKDDSPFGLLDPSERRVPFDNMETSDQYLVIFNDADHMVFAAQRRGDKFSEADQSVMKLTCEVMLEFLKKYLLKTNSAIDSREFSDKLAAYAIFEKKLIK